MSKEMGFLFLILEKSASDQEDISGAGLFSHLKQLNAEQNILNNHFQDIGSQGKKDRDRKQTV